MRNSCWFGNTRWMHQLMHPCVCASFNRWMHQCMHPSIHESLNWWVHQFMDTSLDVCIYVYIHIYIYIYIYIHQLMDPSIDGSISFRIHQLMDLLDDASINSRIHELIIHWMMDLSMERPFNWWIHQFIATLANRPCHDMPLHAMSWHVLPWYRSSICGFPWTCTNEIPCTAFPSWHVFLYTSRAKFKTYDHVWPFGRGKFRACSCCMNQSPHCLLAAHQKTFLQLDKERQKRPWDLPYHLCIPWPYLHEFRTFCSAETHINLQAAISIENVEQHKDYKYGVVGGHEGCVGGWGTYDVYICTYMLQ